MRGLPGQVDVWGVIDTPSLGVVASRQKVDKEALGGLQWRTDNRPKTPLGYPCCEELALNSDFGMAFDVCRDSLATPKGSGGD